MLSGSGTESPQGTDGPSSIAVDTTGRTKYATTFLTQLEVGRGTSCEGVFLLRPNDIDFDHCY